MIGSSLFERVAASLRGGGATPSQPSIRSIWTQAATSYARRPGGDGTTIPTGFDPRAALLFEAVVEAAFLVANADGEFDRAERHTFEALVRQACVDELGEADAHGLVSELWRQLQSDGVEQRVRAVSRAVARSEHKLEVMRIAGLMANASGGVKASERAVLEALSAGLGLGPSAVDDAIQQAREALGGH